MPEPRDDHLPGVMDASYARGRREAPHLAWRFKVRAAEAVAELRRLSPAASAPRVLDLGAAEGLTLLEMRRLLGERGTYDGVELSDSLLGQAPALPVGTRLLRGNVMAVPGELEARSYDLVTILAVLEHLPEPECCLAEAFRMVRPGGVVVATCPNPFWDEVAGRLRMVADEHHEQHLDGRALSNMLISAGFQHVEYRPFMWAPTGLLPYLRVMVPVEGARRVDSLVRRLPRSGPTFVNQLVSGVRP